MERELTVKFEGPATEQVHLPMRSLLAIIEVLEGAIRKRCGRLHTLKTMCEFEIVSFDAPSSTAQLRLQGSEDCERAWRSEGPLQHVMTELECTAGDAPHPPGRLRGQVARCLVEGLDAVEIEARGCGSRQRLANADRATRPYAWPKSDELLDGVDVDALDALLRG